MIEFSQIAPEVITATAFATASTAAVPITTAGGKHTVFFTPTKNCFIRFGTASVGAATSSHWPLIAGVQYRFTITSSSSHFRVIRDTDDGNLHWYISGATA